MSEQQTEPTLEIENKEYAIDVDTIIAKWNAANPDKKELSRTQLAKDMGVNPQLFSDWKHKKTPKWVKWLMHLVETGNCEIGEFIKERTDDEPKN